MPLFFSIPFVREHIYKKEVKMLFSLFGFLLALLESVTGYTEIDDLGAGVVGCSGSDFHL